MINFLGEYSNGWGHLIMSLALLAISVFMFMSSNATLIGAGMGLVTAVSTYWLVTSAANTAAKSAAQVRDAASVAQGSSVPPAGPPPAQA